MDSDSSHDTLKELTTSRTRYIAELADRLATLRQGLARLANLAEPGVELNALRRRLHALAAAAEVLRFTATARALGEAEATLASSGAVAPGAPARERVARILDLLPSLALGVPLDLDAELELLPSRAAHTPCSVVVLGPPSLAALLHKPGPLHDAESHVTEQPEELLELVSRLHPDVVVLDADVADSAELVPRLRQVVGARATPLIAVGSLERPEPLLRLARRGIARVVHEPVDAIGLQRAVRQLSTGERSQLVPPPKFSGSTPSELVEAIAAEARRAFGGATAGREPPRVEFQSDAEVLSLLWSAFARIRGLAGGDAGSPGAPFPLQGPFGAVPLAPAPARAPSSSRAPSEKAPGFAGRSFVVAVSDLAVLTLLCKLLEQLGASTRPARDGQQALELVERFWPDAVIADTLLPSLDGFELCRRLRQDVVLWDVPVALLAWKDYLLERAKAPGKEGLDAASIAPALEQCLSDRLELEQHLVRSVEVHGRLQTASPRALLELACRRTEPSLLTLHDAKLKFELAVGEGCVLDARLFEAGKLLAAGESVLGSFLGTRSGRFRLAPLSSTPAGELRVPWKQALEPIIARARRARDRLAAPAALADIERCELDAAGTARYLAETPGAPHGALHALLERGSLRSLLPVRGAPGSAAAAEIAFHLLELARRGAVLGLLDRAGNDLLSDGPRIMAPASEPEPARAVEPAVVAAASRPVLDLGEAVFDAVRATPASEDERGLESRDADPVPSPRAPSPARSFGAEPETGPAESSASDDPVDVSTDGGFGAETRPDLRERLRGVAAPAIVTLAAASIAFVGMRALGGGVAGVAPVEPVSESTPAPNAANGTAISPAAKPGLAPPKEPAGAPALAPPGVSSSAATEVSAATGVDGSLLAEQRKVPADVSFSTELLELPPHAKVRPGHGLLEVRSWEPRQIYVDGVFMGNYATRLIPLGPGTYQLRLGNGDKSMERAVEVLAGRRTRLVAKPKVTP